MFTALLVVMNRGFTVMKQKIIDSRLFGSSKNQPRKRNHPPPRQCKLAHSSENKAVFNGRKRGIIGPSSI
ncbi:unnamed protein product [Acanthoscelides obtectus]|uniref:Uncharacterized protein n=1 Tax=Acanthoscelides obtectus TaxID=200917 RepID=A0A9P0LYA9_ACAOB|nr:unnamed protein product [Acanthoscelides obtectus]CAK1677850.1 hypothetical protein AOBTE_LOCUS31588 [Acanthoscelides obtectus]